MSANAMGGPASSERPRYRIDRTEALRYLGYTGQQMDASLEDRFAQAVARCEEVSNPGFTYRVFPVEGLPEGIRLAGTTLVLKGRDIATHLAGARECAVMAATAGLANERELRLRSAMNGLDGMLFDAAGSALVETVADACNAAIIADAHARGLHAKWRYSPGYGDLPLDVQPAILRVLDAGKRLGITTEASNLMIPAKSVTAFVGLFETPQEGKRSCVSCSFAPFCELRKRGSSCHEEGACRHAADNV